MHLPEGWVPVARNTVWRIERPAGGRLPLAIHSRADLGVLCVFHVDEDSERLLRELTGENPDPDALSNRFQWPGGERLRYDVHAPKDRWVMISAGERRLDRDFDHWPRIEGAVNSSSQ